MFILKKLKIKAQVKMFTAFANRCRGIVSFVAMNKKIVGWSYVTVNTAFMTATGNNIYYDCDIDLQKRNTFAATQINCAGACGTLDSDKRAVLKETIPQNEMKKYLDILHDNWEVKKIDNKWHLIREFYVETIDEIQDISNAIFEISKPSNYHPDMLINGQKKITLDVYSFKMNGLRLTDFVFAARVDIEIEKIANALLV
eukprot:48407_1